MCKKSFGTGDLPTKINFDLETTMYSYKSSLMQPHCGWVAG